MHELAYLIERLSTGLYFICAVGILISVRRWVIARGKLHGAEFELEREMAQAQQARAVTWSIGMIEIALAIVAIANIVAPTLRRDALATNRAPAADTAVSQNFATSVPGSSGQGIDSIQQTAVAQAEINSSSGVVIVQTPLPSPSPVGTIIAGVAPAVGCTNPGATLLIPANGQVLFDSVTVVGTANIPNFAFYKIELRGPSTGGQFAPIPENHPQPVPQQGTLAEVALSQYQPGDYAFRLAIFDSKNALKAACMVNVQLRLRPTQTPAPTK